MSRPIVPHNKFLILLPFFYLLTTRMNGLKGWISNATSAWIPGVLVLLFWGRGDAVESPMQYLIGYLVFLCIYEIGYFANDTLGLRKDETPRRRFDADFGIGAAVSFVLIRAVVLGSAVACFRLYENIFWLSSMAALCVVIVAHNALQSPALKAATFIQMSLLRFSLPIIPFIAGSRIGPLFVMAFLHFTYPRFITYLDSKGRLNIPERKTSEYGVGIGVLLFPASFLVFMATHSWLPLVLWAYYVGMQIVRYAYVRIFPVKTPGTG